MPKDRRATSSVLERAMTSPYASTVKLPKEGETEHTPASVGDEQEWEETRCPICMDHPHNAVMILCSSRSQGCRPYMCDTSYRHSNCLDQFRKSGAAASSSQSSPGQEESKPVCPLCRGMFIGWIIVGKARRFMDLKKRSCSLETCDFVGNYAELRRHARVEHPTDRPSEASPTRQLNWEELERERDLEDALAHQLIDSEMDEGPPFWDEMDEDGLWSDESFFDFASGLSDTDDGIVDISASVDFYLSLSSFQEVDIVGLGSPGNGDGLQSGSPLINSSSRSDNGRNAPSRSRPSERRRNVPSNSRSQDISRESSNRIFSRSRSSHRRVVGSNYSRPSSSHHGENFPASSSSRSSNSNGDSRPMARLSSDGSVVLPPVRHGENFPASSRSRSSNSNGDARPMARFSSDGSVVLPPVRHGENFPASSRSRSSNSNGDARPVARLSFDGSVVFPPVRRQNDTGDF